MLFHTIFEHLWKRCSHILFPRSVWSFNQTLNGWSLWRTMSHLNAVFFTKCFQPFFFANTLPLLVRICLENHRYSSSKYFISRPGVQRCYINICSMMISHVHGPCVLLGTTQGQLRKCIKSISKRDTNVGDWVGLSTHMNWAQAVKYGYHLHIDGIVVTDPFKSNLPTTMSSATVSERQHIVNLSFRDHFSLVLCYYWVVWISPLLSYHCWFFPLQQHGFFGLNSKLHLGLVFEIGFCFLSKIHSSIKSVAMLLFFIYTPKRRGPFFLDSWLKNWLTKIKVVQKSWAGL